MDVYLEIGRKRVFAGAIDWPGWCRPARDERGALQALIDYAPRYRRIARGLEVPTDVTALQVVERLGGDATTDFGAPGAIPSADQPPLDEVELHRRMDLLSACWTAFAGAVESARGKQLATGPRGGGRNLEAIVEHVRDAHESYARKVGGQSDFERALLARWRGEAPESGPRGGSRWPPAYAIRRAAWHILDHAWEMEDRSSS